MWINPESCAGKATNTHMYLVVVWVTVAWLSVVAVCWRRRLGAGGLSWPVEPVTGTPSHWHQITTLPRPALSTHLLSTLGAGEGSMWWLDREQWGCSESAPSPWLTWSSRRWRSAWSSSRSTSGQRPAPTRESSSSRDFRELNWVHSWKLFSLWQFSCTLAAAKASISHQPS